MATNNSLWAMEKTKASIKEQNGVTSLDPMTTLQVEVVKLSKQINDMRMGSLSQVAAIQNPCEQCCQVGHLVTNCFLGGVNEEQINFVGFQQGSVGNNPYFNTYNPAGETTRIFHGLTM
ncbi:unnamed protein product [Dovyalis caffra]|uniref:Retrotransposon gag protein n=1 Tax=Dovyalis caffra TaxID=77055 RepID=A0AAV1SQN4_9ROSI|nr:unnamed protein product [Dovyalis caffra]